MEATGRGRTKGKTPKAVTLSLKLEESCGSGKRDDVLDKLVAEEEAAIQAVRQSALSPEEQEAILKKLRREEVTVAGVWDLVAMYAKKSAHPGKPFAI